MKARFTLKILIQQLGSLVNMKSVTALVLALFLSANSVRAQVDLLVTTEPTSDGNHKLDSIKTGSNFIFVIDYSISSLTHNGNNVVIKVNLPTNLTVAAGSSSIAYDHSQISSVTNSGGVVTATCINPIPAGSTGQMQISMLYTNGSTPYGYQPNIITTITGTNANVSPVSDTTDIKALASNSITLSKTIKSYNSGGSLYSPVTFNLSYNNSGGSTGNLNLYNAAIVDTLPPGVNYLDATNFTGTTRTVDSVSYPNHTIVTWSWGASTFSGTGSATLTVQYTSPNFSTVAPNNTISNCITLNGNIPVLPFVGVNPSLAAAPPIYTCVSGTLIAASNGITNPGTGIGTNIPGMCPNTVMAGSTATFTAGWTNSGNTQLDSVQVTYSVDPNIDVTSIYAKQVTNPVPGSAIPNLLVYEYYQVNDNPGNWIAVTGSPFTNNSGWVNSHAVTLAAGEYITHVRITVKPGTDPIGAYFTQNLNYTGSILTVTEGAHGGGVIIEGSNNLGTCTVNSSGTDVQNCYGLVATANGNPLTSSPTCGNTKIVGPAPVFSSLSKTSTNGTSFGPAVEVDWEISAKQLGIGTAQNVTWTDVLDSRLSYIPNSAQFKLGSGGTYAAIDPSKVIVSGQTLTIQLDPVDSGSQVYVKIGTMIADGTAPSTISNHATLASTNSYINAGNPTTNTPTVTVISAAAYTSILGQDGCDTTHFVYYPENAHATPQGKIKYRALLRNTGNVGANHITLIDVFPYIGDARGSQYFANLAAPITFNDPSSTIYYDTVSNPCMPEFSPAVNPTGCKTANWNTVAPADITAVKAIKITRSATIAPLDSLVYTWPMILPVGVPANITMYNSYTYQLNRTDNGAQLLPATPNKVGMITDCTSPLGSLGNYAWVDSNANGLQDEGVGGGINGLKVYLYQPGPSNVIGGSDQVLLDSTFTATDFFGNPGYYTFTGLNTGDYYVKFPSIAGKVFTKKDQTAKTDGNSDADRSTGYSAIVHINVPLGGLDKDNPTIDAGYIICTVTASAPKTDISCNNYNDGKISVSFSGNRGPVTFLWNDGNTAQNRTFLAAGNYTVQVMDSVGCQTPIIKDSIINPPVLTSITGSATICKDSTITLANAVPGGVWKINDTSIASIDSATGVLTGKGVGTGIVTYKVSNYACGITYAYPTVLDCSGAVSGGGGGGLESHDLGDAVAQRVYAKAYASQNGKVDYNKLTIVGAANQTARPTTFGVGVSSVTLASIMPDITKIGFVAYNSTPTDIVTLTNATEVIATDFTVNQQPKAVAFATKTLGALYDHTKPICDRLKGASLLDVQNITVGGYNFVQYTMKDENGITEYATSFSVGTKAGRSDFSIQSTWLSKDYVSDDVMYNFQLWAATPQLVNAMITDVLTKVQTMAAVTPLVTTNIPATYVMSGNRTGTNLDMVITNTAAGATGYFTLEDKASESSTGTTATRQIPFTVNANGKSTVSIPMNDLYESTITMYVNGVMKDVVYMSDGTWSVDYNKVTTTVNSFTISNDANRVYDPSEYAVLRNASVKGNSSDYVSVFKLLRGGAAETDLSAYKGLKLTAAGGYTLRVTLVKNSIVNWNDQYYTEIKLDDAQKDYYISMDKFASTASTNKITANDVTTVVFAIEVGTGRSAAINTTLSNISFTKVDQSYINSLDSKEIQLYPNPATAKNFSCSFYSNQAQQLTLHVTDVMGRTVATQQVSAIKGLNVVPVALKSGTNGMHIVSLDGADVKYNSKKVLIE